jgi:hypothetical protein
MMMNFFFLFSSSVADAAAAAASAASSSAVFSGVAGVEALELDGEPDEAAAGADVVADAKEVVVVL